MEGGYRAEGYFIDQAVVQMNQTHQSYREGLVTEGEALSLIISNTTERVAEYQESTLARIQHLIQEIMAVGGRDVSILVEPEPLPQLDVVPRCDYTDALIALDEAETRARKAEEDVERLREERNALLADEESVRADLESLQKDYEQHEKCYSAALDELVKLRKLAHEQGMVPRQDLIDVVKERDEESDRADQLANANRVLQDQLAGYKRKVGGLEDTLAQVGSRLYDLIYSKTSSQLPGWALSNLHDVLNMVLDFE